MLFSVYNIRSASFPKILPIFVFSDNVFYKVQYFPSLAILLLVLNTI